MISQGQVGPVANRIGDSVQSVLRMGQQGDQLTSKLQPDLYEQTVRGRRYRGANQAGQTTTVGLATTYTGLCLSNPVNSPVNLVIDKVSFAFLVAFTAAAAIGLMVGYNSGTNVTHTTPGTVRNDKGDLAAGYGLIDTAATLPTAPEVAHLFGSGLTGAITTTPHIIGGLQDLDGSIVLPPGGYAAIYTSTASGASSMLAAMHWSEVPLLT